MDVLSLCNQVERFGKPTWRRLVEAVEDRVGGNNHALALKIAAEHPGMQPYIMSRRIITTYVHSLLARQMSDCDLASTWLVQD